MTLDDVLRKLSDSMLRMFDDQYPYQSLANVPVSPTMPSAPQRLPYR